MLDFYDAILGAETIGGGGGGGSATLITKSIDANGTYSASSDNADGYSAVTVTVPNTYTQSDEGKVVDNGALVAQTAYPSTITENNTYDTTNYNSVTVNVSGGTTYALPPQESTNTSLCNISTFTDHWSAKNWTGLTNFSGEFVWTDGTDIYYSIGETTHYVLDKSTSTWSAKTWNNIPYKGFYGNNIWTDGTDIYLTLITDIGSGAAENYYLDKSTSTWVRITNWTNVENKNSYNYGYEIWTDGTDIYYSQGPLSAQYVFDKTTKTWSNVTITAPGSYIYGNNIWTDGTDIYYSSGSVQYVFDKTTKTFTDKYWSGNNIKFEGRNIWTNGTDIYCVYASSTSPYQNYFMTIFGNSRIAIDFTGLTLPKSSYAYSSIWSDGDNIYYSYNTDQYVLDKVTPTITTTSCSPKFT